jgi:hypothetical protein
MNKKGLGLNDIAIPGVPYENRMGTDDANLAVSNKFFGKEYLDDHNSNSLPIASKRNEAPEEAAYEKDPVAEKYFQKLLKLRSDKKNRNK